MKMAFYETEPGSPFYLYRKLLDEDVPEAMKNYIVWYISICASFSRWVLEFAFQVSVSLECGPFGQLNRSNRIRLCGFLQIDIPSLDLKIC
jgi:hypothetical protein